jgi:hypothetical protein
MKKRGKKGGKREGKKRETNHLSFGRCEMSDSSAVFSPRDEPNSAPPVPLPAPPLEPSSGVTELEIQPSFASDFVCELANVLA